MRSLLLIACCYCSFFCSAQKKKVSIYYYTPASQRFFSDTEMDSIFYETAKAAFTYNDIPGSVFEEQYPVLKSQLIALSRKDITQSFKWVESTGENTIHAPKGSATFESTKKLYLKYLVKYIDKAFVSNRSLNRYFSFNGSDRITHFNSTVRVGMDGKLTVTENISIHNGDGTNSNGFGAAEGTINNEIKRGIVRAFPLYYVNDKKLFQNTTFKVKSVYKNGEPETWHTEKKENGILLFTGSEYVFLKNGNYDYSITYESEHQIKFLQDYDELAWNVTGTGWNFRMDSVTCTIIIPKAAVLSNHCYTGVEGAKNEDCNFTSEQKNDSTYIYFRTTRPLLPRHGITVATSWKKGIVQAPSSFARAKYFTWNNKAVFFLPIATLLAAIFCFFYWLKYGRDLQRGSVHPLYEPPAGFSPAALGYIYDQYFTRQLTAATIVDAAVRNIVKVNVEQKGWLMKHNAYNISRSGKDKKKATSAYEDFESDVNDLVGTVIEKGKYNKSLGDLNTKLEAHCESTYKNKDGFDPKKKSGFFSLNSSYTTIPVLLCVAAGLWGFFGSIFTIVNTRNFWQLAWFGAGVILCIIVFKIFYKLLPAYNREGRILMDKIEGFRMFLSTADASRFSAMAPPAKTLELYEKYLPFAIALGCEIAWGRQFENILDTAYLDPESAGMSGFTSSMRHDSSSLGSSFASSFAGAISSASSPPSSSSGGGSSFGGGSSGGGGGGGGGGGW